MTVTRKNLRLKHFDYSQSGAYFITVCVQDRVCLFGNVTDGMMQLNEASQVVLQTWQGLLGRVPAIELDEFVVMPNHVHGILHIVRAPLMAPVAPEPTASEPSGAMNRASTLGEMVRTFKAASTRAIRQQVLPSFAWQRNYYEHIIRNIDELTSIRTYIVNNPLQWSLDRENPAAKGRLGLIDFTAIFGRDLP